MAGKLGNIHHADVMPLPGGPRVCPVCGKPSLERSKYCSEGCRGEAQVQFERESRKRRKQETRAQQRESLFAQVQAVAQKYGIPNAITFFEELCVLFKSANWKVIARKEET